jgi:hypothetical protein
MGDPWRVFFWLALDGYSVALAGLIAGKRAPTFVETCNGLMDRVGSPVA